MYVSTKTYYVHSHSISWPSFSHVQTYRGLIASDKEYARIVSASSIGFKELSRGVHHDPDQEDTLSKLSKRRWSRHYVGFIDEICPRER